MKKRLVVLFIALAFFATAGIAAAGNNPPGLMFSTVLNGVKMDARQGDFHLYNIQAVFLPEPSVKSKSIYPYNPDDGGKLWAELKNAGGATAARYDFYAQKIKAPFWLLNSYKVTETATGNQPSSGRIHLDPGDYSLDFYVEGAHFYHFPFKVEMLGSQSDFNPENYWFLDGDWSDWGYFYYAKADPSMAIQWKAWLRNKAAEPYKDARVELEVKKGGKVVCVNRPNMTFSLRPEWNRFEFDLIFPPQGTSGGAYFKAKDLLAQDGPCTLEMKINGQPYGAWNVEISGGKFKTAGRAARGQGDPKTFVEGGVDAFWYGK